MKRFISGFLAGLILMGMLMFSITALAEGEYIVDTSRIVKIKINGREIPMDPPPLLISHNQEPHRTYVPLRFVAEAMNMKVEFDDAASTVNVDNMNPGNLEGIVLSYSLSEKRDSRVVGATVYAFPELVATKWSSSEIPNLIGNSILRTTSNPMGTFSFGMVPAGRYRLMTVAPTGMNQVWSPAPGVYEMDSYEKGRLDTFLAGYFSDPEEALRVLAGGNSAKCSMSAIDLIEHEAANVPVSFVIR